MKFSSNAAYSFWKRFFHNNESRLLLLPEDVLVDEIFKWLSVRDIVRLRQVCRALALLTKKPAIWKRFLPYVNQIQQPLAPLPPTMAYSLSNLTGHEMETVVTRAISYDMTWKRKQIECRDTFSVFAHYHVEEMVLLPGGHFLVMSVKSFDDQYGIVIWSLEHRATRKPALLAFRHTDVKAYGLTAKYMAIDGFRSLVIAFLTKKHKDPSDRRHIPETFEMGGREDPEDPYMPIKYECTVVCVSLTVLDYLNDRRIGPMTDQFDERIKHTAISFVKAKTGSWLTLARIRTGSQLGVVSLDILDESPFVCVVKRPDKIVFQLLTSSVEDSERSILECTRYPEYLMNRHSIWNFRVLPDQNRVLVVRNIEKRPNIDMKNDHLAIELFQIPQPYETLVTEATAVRILTLRQYVNVQISDLQRTVPSKEDDSITPNLRLHRRPQPLSIFLRTETGMTHRSLWPIQKPVRGHSTETCFIYDPAHCRHIVFGDQRHGILNEEMDDSNDGMDDEDEGRRNLRRRKNYAMRFIPGARRAFVYAIPRDYRSTEPPITACWGFQYNMKDRTIYLGDQNDDDDIDLLETDVPDSPLSAASTLADDPDVPYYPGLDVPPLSMERTTMLGPVKLPENLRDKLLQGVSGVSFDEDSGRVVFATKKDNRLHVVDFARTRRRDTDDNRHNAIMDEEFGYEDSMEGVEAS
ncbi:hypothetical protein ACEPAF_4014 [Sanghuangporus sanghuang]